MDYMAAGLSIVASDQARVRELVTHGESGMALIELAENAALRQRLGLVARERVPTLSDTAQRVLAVSSEVMTAKRGAA